jgi:hypothetical protein
MPQSQYLRLGMPMGGLYRRLSYQSHPPYTTASCSNVRPDDTLAQRERLGMRPGLSKHFATELGSGNPVRLVSDVLYQTSGVPATKLVASANGLLYFSDGAAMTEVGGSPPTLASDRMLTAADHLGLLYISGSDSANTELCVYDPSDDSLELLVASSVEPVPTGCEIVSMWRDRIVLCGDINNPHLWYMSKSGDPTNWDYSPGTTTSLDAVAATNSDAGRIGEPVRAFISHSDDCGLFGCSSSLWALRGDPQAGGRLTRLSDEVGIIDRAAWCYDSEGYLYFLSQDGLYMMGPGCGETPSSVSREKLPAELLRIDTSAYTVSLAYDFLARGVHVFVSKNVAGAVTHYFIDVKQSTGGDVQRPQTVSFWPTSLGSTAYEPFSLFSRRNYIPAIANSSPTILGCRDGYLRQFDTSVFTDDGTAIAWHFDIGPVPLGGVGYEGLLDELSVSVATGSGNIQAAVRAGQTAEAAYNASAFETYDLNATGLNLTHRPRMRGDSAFIKVSGNESGTTAAVEDVLIRRSAAGVRRPY